MSDKLKLTDEVISDLVWFAIRDNADPDPYKQCLRELRALAKAVCDDASKGYGFYAVEIDKIDKLREVLPT